MTEIKTEPLKIRLTAPLPRWAEAGLSALRQQPCLEIITDDNASDTPIDIVLHFGIYSNALQRYYDTARLGIWYFRFGGQDLDVSDAARRAAAVGVAVECSLWAIQSDHQPVCLYQSFGQNDDFAVWRSVTRTLAKASYFPERVLSYYRRTGELPVCNAEQIAISSSDLNSRIAEIGAIARKIFYKLFYHEQWFIVAGKEQALVPDPSKAEWTLMPPADSFWADPFPIEKDGRVWILLEVLPFATWRGHLAAVELLPNGNHSAAQNIMLQDYHLSYPFLLEWQGELYMLPEAGVSRAVTLWRCEQFPDRWTKAATLLTDICFTDATIIEHNGLWWLFLTIGEEDGICLQDELYLYYADSLLGSWTRHPENPVKSDARNARPAGNLFHRDGVLYRPAQDCATGYGKAVVLNRVDTLTTEQFSETPVARIDTNWREGNRCTHTLSRSENYWAVDGLRLLPKWWKP
jgi:hypothetical protein